MMSRALPLACSLPPPIPPYAVMSGNVAHTARCTRIVFATRPASTAEPDAQAGYDDTAAALDEVAFFVGAAVAFFVGAAVVSSTVGAGAVAVSAATGDVDSLTGMSASRSMLPRLSVSTSRLRVAVTDRGAATALWPTGEDAVSTSPAHSAVATAAALTA